MEARTQNAAPVLTTIGVDIGKDVFHIVGFDAGGKITLRRKIKRLALVETFKKLPPCVVGMEACLSAHFVSRTLRALGRISKRGSRYLRTLFIQAANIILMWPHNWERYSFGAWLKEAATRLHRNKAATALANKLTRIAWSVLRNGKIFDLSHSEVPAI